MSLELIRTKPAPKPDDVPLRIYSNPICPFAQRARLIAAAKGIKHEIINVHLKEKSDWFLELNPFGQVPVIEHNGHIIRESAIAFDYIDESFGDKSLWPTDLYKKAQSKLILNDCGSLFIPNYYKCIFGKDDEETSKNIVKFLKSLEAIISQYGGPFIMGNEVSAIDYLIWPWFEKLPYYSDKLLSIYKNSNIPLVIKWEETMRQEEAAIKTALLPEDFKAFAEHLKTTGTHDYSLLKIDGLKIYTKTTD